MLLHRRGIVFEVSLVLLAVYGVVSAYESYSPKKAKQARSDFAKYYGNNDNNNKPAASGLVTKQKNPQNIYAEEFDAFVNAPFSADEEPQGSREATAPKPKYSNDPYEIVSKAFAEADDFYNGKKENQQADSSEVQPGPYYSSHKVPKSKYLSSGEESDEEEEDDDDEEGSQSKKEKKKISPEYSEYEDPYGFYAKLAKEDEQYYDQSRIDPTIYGGKKADYNTGKSSSTVSQHPAATYHSQTTVTPYDTFTKGVDYDALQSKYLGAILSTPRSVKHAERQRERDDSDEDDDGSAAPSETVPENLKKNCRRIHGPEAAEGMSCFVCNNDLTKAKYTQCSYDDGSPEGKSAGSSYSYSTPVKPPAHLRHKRSPKRQSRGAKYDTEHDPYFEVYEKSRKYFEDLEKEQAAAESERDKDYHYKPWYPDESSYSESQSSELLKTPGACKEVTKDGSVCTVCKDPKTGGNFEQCSYASAPKEHKYAYVAEKKFDSEDEPEEGQNQESGEEGENSEPTQQVTQTAASPSEQYASPTKSKIIVDPVSDPLAAAGSSISESAESPDDKQKKENDGDSGFYFNYGELKNNKKLVDDDPYDVPEHFAESINQKTTAADDEEEENFDEYHYKLFPELYKGAESRNEEQRADATEEKQQDVEEVLAEFAKKDRTNCKKAEKNGMTCFLCVDQNKVQHEECMYIAESKPRPTHIAYHEVQRLKDPNGEHHPLVAESDETSGEESKKVEVSTQQPLDIILPLASETTKRKRFFKKVISAPLPLANLQLSAAASDVHRTVVPFEEAKEKNGKKAVAGTKDSKASGSAPDSERLEDDNKQQGSAEPETPKEVDVGDEEGAYSHETKPVFSKLYGTTLPRYMVEKTDFEKDFDAAAGFD